MSLIREARIRVIAAKYVIQFRKKKDEELELMLDQLKDKYKITDEDYVKMNVAITFMTDKEILKHTDKDNDEQTI